VCLGLQITRSFLGVGLLVEGLRTQGDALAPHHRLPLAPELPDRRPSATSPDAVVFDKGGLKDTTGSVPRTVPGGIGTLHSACVVGNG